MRAATRLLAAAPPQRFLEAGSPTGLTGLFTHAAPRSTLMYVYHQTLDKLAAMPDTSVYRQSTEALTRHRLAIVEKCKPDGLDAWQARVRDMVDANPAAFRKVGSTGDKSQVNIIYKQWAKVGMDTEDWDDEPVEKPMVEGPRTVAEKAGQADAFSRDLAIENAKIPRIEPEPPLSVEQIGEIESQIGAGLIEEIIQVAEAEHELVDRMIEAKVWEELEVKPTEDQWSYYQRDTHTPTTQAP